MTTKIQLRRDTAANWTANNPTLAAGELGFELDTNKFKIGTGSTAWNDLNYASGGGPAGGDLTGYYPNPSIGSGVITNTNISGTAAISSSKIAGTAATLSGNETLTNKNITSGSITLSSGPITTTSGTVSALALNASSYIASGSGRSDEALYVKQSNTTPIARFENTNASYAGDVWVQYNASGTQGQLLLSARNNGDVWVASYGTGSLRLMTNGGTERLGISPTGNVTLTGSLTTNTGTISAAALGGSLLTNTTPYNLGIASPGSLTIPARADHVHSNSGLSTSIPISFVKTGTLTTGTGILRWYNDLGSKTIDTVRASVGVAPTGSSIIVDVNVNGTSIYGGGTARPTIGTSSFTNTGGSKTSTPYTLGSASYITVDIDQIGSTVAGSDLTVTIILI